MKSLEIIAVAGGLLFFAWAVQEGGAWLLFRLKRCGQRSK